MFKTAPTRKEITPEQELIRDTKILKNLQYRRSYKDAAHRVKMTVGEYAERKAFLESRDINDSVVIKDNYIAVLEDRITNSKINLEAGTGTMEGLFSYEPQSAEQVIVLFKIDTSKWRLSSYWNKQQASGKYLVSVNISQLKGNEVSREDMSSVISKVFGEKKIRPFTFKTKQSNQKSLMVYTSDKHIGAYLPDNALYKNEYSVHSFEKRMELLLEEIAYLFTLYGRFENIHIMDLGDSMDGMNGQTTRGGHSLPQNMSNVEAFECYVQTHKNFFDRLVTAGFTNHIYFTAAVNDNHSAEFGYFTNRALEEYLNVKYPQLHTRIAKKFIDHFVMGNHTFIFSHGKDSEDMKHGLPLHINDKTENFINHYIDHNNIDFKTSQVHFIKGDLHQNCSESAAKFRYRNTLSMFGSSKWAMHNFIPQAPGVSFDIVENNTNRVYEYKLQFNSSVTG